MKSEILYPGAFPMVRVDLASGESVKAESGAMVAAVRCQRRHRSARSACRPLWACGTLEAQQQSPHANEAGRRVQESPGAYVPACPQLKLSGG